MCVLRLIRQSSRLPHTLSLHRSHLFSRDEVSDLSWILLFFILWGCVKVPEDGFRC